jgi:uncharacterized protein DUF4260
VSASYGVTVVRWSTGFHLLLRLEGLTVLVAALVLYFHADYGWLLVIVLFFTPDLSMAAYALGPRAGALAYDALHTEVFAIALGTTGIVANSETATKLALIWLGHIGLDRTLGYGLKYPTAFKDTHLQRV